jgi:hypothetical protein
MSLPLPIMLHPRHAYAFRAHASAGSCIAPTAARESERAPKPQRSAADGRAERSVRVGVRARGQHDVLHCKTRVVRAVAARKRLPAIGACRAKWWRARIREAATARAVRPKAPQAIDSLSDASPRRSSCNSGRSGMAWHCCLIVAMLGTAWPAPIAPTPIACASRRKRRASHRERRASHSLAVRDRGTPWSTLQSQSDY